MNSDQVKISAIQFGIIIIVTVVGVGILSLPRAVVEIAGTDGWLLVLFAGATSLGLLLIMNALSNMFPGKTIMEYSKELLGYPLSMLIAGILSIYYIVNIAFVVRIFGEVLKMFLLPKTPIEVIIITLLITSAYLVRGNFEGIIRFYQIIILIMFIPYFLAISTGVKMVDFTNILPMFQTSPKIILPGTLKVISSFFGFEIILLYAPFVSDRKNMKKSIIITISIITLIYFISTIIVLANFGSEEIKHLVWPLMSYIKSVQIPGTFIEQLEGVIISLWVLFTFTTLSTMYLSIVFIFSRVTKVKEHKIFTIFLLPIMYILALQPENVPQIYDWLEVFSAYAGILVLFIIPIILWIMAKVQKKGVKMDG